MAATGTIIPCKSAKFTFNAGTAVEIALDDVTLRGQIDLVDVSTNVSQGWDELVGCFQRLSADWTMPYRFGGWPITMGVYGIFTAIVIPTSCELASPMTIESIDVLYKAKDVWRLRVSGKSSAPATFSLP